MSTETQRKEIDTLENTVHRSKTIKAGSSINSAVPELWEFHPKGQSETTGEYCQWDKSPVTIL